MLLKSKNYSVKVKADVKTLKSAWSELHGANKAQRTAGQ